MWRGDPSDTEWDRLRPFLPVSNRRCGRRRDHRQVIDGILHRLRTGVQWRDLPERFGPWKTVYERRRLWSADGPGGVCCSRSGRQRMRRGKTAGTSRWTPPSCAHISTRRALVPIRRRRPLQKGPNARTRRCAGRGRG
ncbi:transposase [Streptomyces sp. CA2R101]|uniref:transposase n=1 Tax=Streptomyces sp. CA2R101 TaxID=3120152 RepID=UPI003FA68524